MLDIRVSSQEIEDNLPHTHRKSAQGMKRELGERI